MPKLELSICLSDLEPMRSLLHIISDMSEDDRVPLGYRVDIAKALLPWIAEGEEFKA